MSAQCAILSFVQAKRLIVKNNAYMLCNISYLFYVFKRLLNLAKNKELYEAAENIHFFTLLLENKLFYVNGQKFTNLTDIDRAG